MTNPRSELFRREFKGSRFRCLLATNQRSYRVREFLQHLAGDHAIIDDKAHWKPEGFCTPDEFMFHDATARELLTDAQQRQLIEWWLASGKRPNSPHWDIISQCLVENRRGLMLVEAKAHKAEMKIEDCCNAGRANLKTIRAAVESANEGLRARAGDWNLSVASHYQLSNRFAWAWKLATMRIPVVLVYLGFVDAWEMQSEERELFSSHSDWEKSVQSYSQGVVPREAWGSRLDVNGTPLTPLIRSVRVEPVVAYC